MREFLNRNANTQLRRLVITSACGVVLLICALVIGKQLLGRDIAAPIVITRTWFVDEETLKPIEKPSDSIAPLLSDSGKPNLVQGIFLTWDGGKTRQLAYLIKYTDRYKKLKEDPGSARPGETVDPVSAMLVRLPIAGSQWVSMATPDGAKLVQDATTRDGLAGTACDP